ncbi:MAG: hypothetical protein A2Y10_18870 [Planctomycetes bacterium GWF2_41_51]|nr:MAG: hypothetical protein A2Y10_18870 [Planctomycetes bacterium GWF2_41_51]HBG27367.1 hypothetical protein [Phycisphaerales bacterium]
MKNGKFIVARLWPTFGGNIPTVVPVICGINPEKYETIGIYLTKKSDVPNLLEQNGKKVFYVTKNSRLPIAPFSFFRLAKILKNQGVDILHCHHHKATFHGTIAGCIAKTPAIVSHVHGMGRTRNLNRKLQNYFLLPRVDRIFAVGQAVKEDIEKHNSSVDSQKVINIGNSIDFDYFANSSSDRAIMRQKYNISNDAVVFATAGRLAPTKGQMFLIEAFAKIKKIMPNAKLLFAGSGQLKAELENRAAELGCKDSVHLPGRVENMPEFYRGIDCFILPSVAEGLPRTLLEAMAAGVFCIASSIGGIPEILDNGRFGLLTPPENINALADAMIKFRELPAEKKTEITNSAREHVKINFNHSVMIKRIEGIYDNLIAQTK